MTRQATPAVLLTVAVLLAGCGGRGEYRPTSEGYADPDQVVLLDDRYNPTDLKMISAGIVESMVTSPAIAERAEKPKIQVDQVVNRTREVIDMKALTDRIRTAALNSGRVRVIAADARESLEREYEYQEGGAVRPDQQRGPGGQESADYLLRGYMSDIVNRGGDKKYTYYKITMELVDITTAEIVWADEVEILKPTEKRGWGW